MHHAWPGSYFGKAGDMIPVPWAFIRKKWFVILISGLVLQGLICCYLLFGAMRDFREAMLEQEAAVSYLRACAEAENPSLSPDGQEKDRAVLRSLVAIYPRGDITRETRSGCFVTSAGLVLTSSVWPSIDGVTSFSIHGTTPDGQWFKVPYETAISDPATGIALLKPKNPLEFKIRPMPIRRIPTLGSYSTVRVSYARLFPRSRFLAEAGIEGGATYKTLIRTRVSASLSKGFFCLQDPVSWTAKGAPLSDEQGYLIGMCLGYMDDELTSRALTLARGITEEDLRMLENAKGQ